MRKWMYGLGKDAAHGASLLKKFGFEAVAGGESAVEETLSKGMDAYLFSGAFRGPAFKGEDWLAEDVDGVKQEWFSSTCPTRREVREYNLSNIRRMAGTPGISGIILDGARFASPMSGKPEAFFTCFCPSCMAKVKEMGFDAEAMKRAVSALRDFLAGKAVDLLPHAEGLEDWLDFRRRATTEHLLDFVNTVHEVKPDLKAGIYIFAPSLCRLVGQNYRDINGKMDLIAPMLYRCYPDADGPACLNVEIARMLDMMKTAHGWSAQERIRHLRALTGIEIEEGATVESLMKGLPVDMLRTETQRARIMAPQGALVPIIEMDDPLLPEASRKVIEGGAEAVSYFLYNEEQLLANEAFFMENN